MISALFAIGIILVGAVIMITAISYVIYHDYGRTDGKRDNRYGNNGSPQTRYAWWAYSRGFVAGKKWRKKQETAISWRKHYKDKADAKIAALDKPKNAEPDEEF